MEGDNSGKTKKKPNKIWSEINGWDVVILTETHLRDNEEERESFEKKFGGKIYEFFHATGKVSDKRGATIMIKKKILKNGRVDIEEQLDEEGRFAVIDIKNLMDRELRICGIYAENNAKQRKEWMKKLEKRLKKKMILRKLK